MDIRQPHTPVEHKPETLVIGEIPYSTYPLKELLEQAEGDDWPDDVLDKVRLMLAAPKLLKALELALPFLKEYAHSEQIQQAEQAINSIKGENAQVG